MFTPKIVFKMCVTIYKLFCKKITFYENITINLIIYI